MAEKHTPIALSFLAIAYMLLGFGLFGHLVEYKYSITLRKSWFDGHEDSQTFDTIFQMKPELEGKQIDVIPLTVRSLFASTVPPTQERSDQSEAGSSLIQKSSRLRRDRGQTGVLQVDPGEETLLTEQSTAGLVPWLLEEARTGRISYFPAVMLIAFGLLLPLSKLLLVIFSLVAPVERSTANTALLVAKHFSRWAAVDAVAEALVVALIMKGGMEARHCEGYAAFIGYVVLSSLAVSLLENPETAQMPLAKSASDGSLPKYLPSFSLVLFIVLMLVGSACFPLGDLYVTREAVLAKTETIVDDMGGQMLSMFLGEDQLKKIEGAFADVVPKPAAKATVLQAALQLLMSGHIYTVVGSVVLFLMVFLFPLVDAIMAMEAIRSSNMLSPSIRFTLKVMADLAMLDVFVVGVVVGCMITAALPTLSCKVLRGWYILALAAAVEALHRVLCHQVKSILGMPFIPDWASRNRQSELAS